MQLSEIEQNVPTLFTREDKNVIKLLKLQGCAACRDIFRRNYLLECLGMFTSGFIVLIGNNDTGKASRGSKSKYFVKGFNLFIENSFSLTLSGLMICSREIYKGIGVQILDATRDHIISSQFTRWEINSLPFENLIKFYQKYGFTRGNTIFTIQGKEKVVKMWIDIDYSKRPQEIIIELTKQESREQDIAYRKYLIESQNEEFDENSEFDDIFDEDFFVDELEDKHDHFELDNIPKIKNINEEINYGYDLINNRINYGQVKSGDTRLICEILIWLGQVYYRKYDELKDMNEGIMYVILDIPKDDYTFSLRLVDIFRNNINFWYPRITNDMLNDPILQSCFFTNKCYSIYSRNYINNVKYTSFTFVIYKNENNIIEVIPFYYSDQIIDYKNHFNEEGKEIINIMNLSFPCLLRINDDKLIKQIQNDLLSLYTK